MIEQIVNQIPEVYRELVIREAMDCCGWLIFNILLSAACVYLIVWSRKKIQDCDDELPYEAIIFSCAIILVISFLGVLANIVNLTELYFVPKGYFVHQVIRAFK